MPNLSNDSFVKVEKLSARYQALIQVCNIFGTEEVYLGIKPLFDEVAAEGKKFGCYFDANPTLRWKASPKKGNTCQKPPEGWICGGPKGHDGPCAAYPADMVVPEIAWLLEIKLDENPAYVSRVVNGRPIFVSDVNAALRFSRKQDAESMAYDIDHGLSFLTATEHVWV
jgi:hypothetical protein